jgi:DNA-binding beta-propeller fold protein YncE
MIKINRACFVAALTVWALLGCPPMAQAAIPGITVADTIDPSLGTDAFGLTLLKVNHATHRFYTTGYPSDSTRNMGLKVVDTTSNSLIAGIDLGRYTGSYNGFWPIGMDVDESAAPAGDKVYLIGRTDSVANVILRVIDGPSNSNATGEGTDLVLPVGVQEFMSLTVNSANHKIYVAKANGEIVVVDGPNRQILGTINPNYGDLVIANPAANKIFVVNHNGGGVINSADDTFAGLSLNFTATAAALDPTQGRIYFVGKTLGNSNSIFAVDATTGQIVGSKSGLANPPLSVTVKPDENTVYVGSASDLLAFDGTDFSSKGGFVRPAVNLACDSAVSAGLFFIDPNQQNSVIAMTFATGAPSTLTMGYRPYQIAVNSRTNRVYVTDEQTNELVVIDGSSHAVINRILIPPPAPPSYTPLLDRFYRHLAVSETLNRIYLPRTSYDSSVGANRSFVDVIDGETNQLRGSIALDPTIGYYGNSVAVDDTRRRIYVTAARFVGTFSAEVVLAVYDADTETRITTLDVGQNFFGGSARALAANPVTGRVYASLDSGVAIVDGNTNTNIRMLDSAGGEIAINRRTNKIYTRSGSSSLAVIDGATDSLETTFPIQTNGDYESAFDVDEVTNRVYVIHANQWFSATGRITAYDANNSDQFIGQIDLPVKPVALAFAGASRQLFVLHDLDCVISAFHDSTPAPAALFGNISTRAHVGPGDDAIIGGFIITGTQPKTVIVRGLGPSLPVTGALADPVIEVHGSSGELLATNDNWKEAATKQQIIDSGLAPGNDSESALWGTINPGSYTVVVRGKNNAAGIALFEVYDLDSTLPQQLANISTRGHVGSGDDVMIAGVIIMGSKSQQTVLRAIGPSLASFGVQNPLEDPLLELRDANGGLITSNDDWQEHEPEVNGTSLAPTDPRESAIVARLYPANYTAIVRGKNGATGVALVEAYHLTAGQ